MTLTFNEKREKKEYTIRLFYPFYFQTESIENWTTD